MASITLALRTNTYRSGMGYKAKQPPLHAGNKEAPTAAADNTTTTTVTILETGRIDNGACFEVNPRATASLVVGGRSHSHYKPIRDVIDHCTPLLAEITVEKYLKHSPRSQLEIKRKVEQAIAATFALVVVSSNAPARVLAEAMRAGFGYEKLFGVEEGFGIALEDLIVGPEVDVHFENLEDLVRLLEKLCGATDELPIAVGGFLFAQRYLKTWRAWARNGSVSECLVVAVDAFADRLGCVDSNSGQLSHRT